MQSTAKLDKKRCSFFRLDPRTGVRTKKKLELIIENRPKNTTDVAATER